MFGWIYCGCCFGFQFSVGCKYGVVGSSVVEVQLFVYRGQVSGMGGECGDGLFFGGVFGQVECGKYCFQQWIYEWFFVGWIDGQLESGCSVFVQGLYVVDSWVVGECFYLKVQDVICYGVEQEDRVEIVIFVIGDVLFCMGGQFDLGE